MLHALINIIEYIISYVKYLKWFMYIPQMIQNGWKSFKTLKSLLNVVAYCLIITQTYCTHQWAYIRTYSKHVCIQDSLVITYRYNNSIFILKLLVVWTITYFVTNTPQ